MLTSEQKAKIAVLIDFAEENWGVFSVRLEESFQEEIEEDALDDLKEIVGR